MDCDYCTRLSIDLHPGLYYLLVEIDWIYNLTRDVTINVYSANTVNMVEDLKMPS
jgi:hypothetical protein